MAPYLTLMKEAAPQRDYPIRELFNALRYVIRYGIAWRVKPRLKLFRFIRKLTSVNFYIAVEVRNDDMPEAFRASNALYPERWLGICCNGQCDLYL